MDHRHVTSGGTAPQMLTEMDDVVERGSLKDWIVLRREVENDVGVRRRLQDLLGQTASISERPDRPQFWIVFCDYLDRRDARVNA